MTIDILRRHRTADGRMVIGLKEIEVDGAAGLTGQVRDEFGDMPWVVWHRDGRHRNGRECMNLVPLGASTGTSFRPPTAGFSTTADAVAAAAPDAPKPSRFLTGEWQTRSGRHVTGLRPDSAHPHKYVSGSVQSPGTGTDIRSWNADTGKHIRDDDLDLVPRVAAPTEPFDFLTGDCQTRDGRLVFDRRAFAFRPGIITGKIRKPGSTELDTRNWRVSDGAHDPGTGIPGDRNLDLVPIGTATEALPTPPPPFDPYKPYRTRSGLAVSLSGTDAAPGFKWAGWITGGSVQSVLYKADGTAWKWGAPMPGLDLINVAMPAKPEMPPIVPPPEPVDPVKAALKESFLTAIRTKRGSSVSGRVITSASAGVAVIGQRPGMAA